MKHSNDFKLPKDKKRKWLKALRSGKYKKGIGCLKLEGMREEEDKYCCLGVACEVKIAKPRRHSNYFCEPTFLPTEIQEDLANCNDCRKWSFKRIANWIEKHL